jgi:predicted Zn-dependent protease
MLRAASALKHDHPDQAITILRPVMNYERGRPDVIYLRGLSYLKSGRGADAAGEFQKIIDHKGQNWGPFYAASYVGLARAAGSAGENAPARIAYRDFLTLWKDADPSIPILTQARQEYARLSNY